MAKVASLAARGFASRGSDVSAFAVAFTASNTIISYFSVLAFIAVVVWVALGLLRQRPGALRAVHVLLPVLLATSALAVLSGLTTGWLQYMPFPSRPPNPQPWIGQVATALEFAAMLWAAMIYCRLSDTPAVSDEWRARAAWALSVPSLISWAWIIHSVQQFRGSTLNIPLYLASGSLDPRMLATWAFRILPYGLLAFFMVRDGLPALERDREAFLRLSRSILAVLIVSVAWAGYLGFMWRASSHAMTGDYGNVMRYVALGYVSAISQLVVLPAVSLFMLWKWQRPRALPLPRPQSETEGGA